MHPGREDAIELDAESAPPSVLDVYATSAAAVANGVPFATTAPSDPVDKLLSYVDIFFSQPVILVMGINWLNCPLNYFLSKSSLSTIFPLLRKIISSGKSDEVASVELAELVGFEEVELVTEIIAHRQAVMSKVRYIFLDFNQSTQIFISHSLCSLCLTAGSAFVSSCSPSRGRRCGETIYTADSTRKEEAKEGPRI